MTHRELGIVPFLVAGRTGAEIAQALVISPSTVGVHGLSAARSSALRRHMHDGEAVMIKNMQAMQDRSTP